MSEHWELIDTQERDGFTVRLYFGPEYDDPRDHFDSGDAEADAEMFRKIDNGTYLWFCAKVTVSKAGIELGHDYLGGCCYEGPKDFMAPDGYYLHMIDEAMSEARATLKKLCAA